MDPSAVLEQAHLVADIEAEIAKHECALKALKKQLRLEAVKLTGMCTHTVLREEPNYDYHRPGVYWVCTTCKRILTQKPTNNNVTVITAQKM